MARARKIEQVIRDPEAPPSWLARQQFRGEAQGRVYKKLGQLTSIQGIGVRSALEIAYDHLSSDGKQPGAPGVRAVAHVAMRMRRGRSFGQAWEGWVSAEHLLLFQAVDRGYPVSRAVSSAVLIEENKRKMRVEVLGAVRQLVQYVLLAGVLLAVIAYVLVPSYGEMVDVEEWTGIPAHLVTLSRFVTGPWALVVIASMLGVSGLVMWSFPRWTGRVRDALGAIEPWRTYRMVAGASFLLAFSGLLGTQSNLQTLLRSLMGPSSRWVSLKIEGILREAQKGKDLGDAMWTADPNWPDREINRELRVVIKQDDQDVAVVQLVTGWVDQSVEKVQLLAKRVRLAGVVVLGGLIGFTYYAMYQMPTLFKDQLVGG